MILSESERDQLKLVPNDLGGNGLQYFRNLLPKGSEGNCPVNQNALSGQRYGEFWPLGVQNGVLSKGARTPVSKRENFGPRNPSKPLVANPLATYGFASALSRWRRKVASIQFITGPRTIVLFPTH